MSTLEEEIVNVFEDNKDSSIDSLDEEQAMIALDLCANICKDNNLSAQDFFVKCDAFRFNNRLPFGVPLLKKLAKQLHENMVQSQQKLRARAEYTSKTQVMDDYDIPLIDDDDLEIYESYGGNFGARPVHRVSKPPQIPNSSQKSDKAPKSSVKIEEDPFQTPKTGGRVRSALTPSLLSGSRIPALSFSTPQSAYESREKRGEVITSFNQQLAKVL